MIRQPSPPRTPGRARQAENRRRRTQQILEQAAQLLREKGFTDTTMEDVAQQFGVTKAAIYYYVKDKQDLLFQIHVQTLELALGAAEEIAAGDASPPDKLRAFIRRHVGMIAERLDLFTVYFNDKGHLRPDDHATVTAMERRLVETVSGIYRDGVAGGYFRDLDPTVSVFAVLGMSSWIYRWYHPGGRLPVQEVAAAIETVAVHGLLAPAQVDPEPVGDRA